MDNYVDVLARESSRVADLIQPEHLERAVPACPDWTFRDLVLHLGEVQRFWAETVRAADPTARWDGERQQPADDDALEDWFRSGSMQLVEALSAAAPDDPSWTWWGEPATASAVGRHQVQELVVHRWDAESCISTPQPIDSISADDGVSEFLSIMMRQKNDELDQSVGLASTDTNAIWLAGPPDAPQAATVTATASDLVLLLYNRVPLSVAHIDGDRSAVEKLLRNPSTY